MSKEKHKKGVNDGKERDSKLPKRDRVIDRILGYLSYYGAARFYNSDFEVEQGPVYAGIELITSQYLAEGLESAINNEINPHVLDSKGKIIRQVPARVQFFPIAEQSDKKIRYTVSIVPEIEGFQLPPNYNIPSNSSKEIEKMILATDLFLERLPKALGNLRQKKICFKKAEEQVSETAKGETETAAYSSPQYL